MGGTLSSNRDYNRVLARQIPASISMPRFDVNNDVLQQANLEPLSTPFPTRFPQHEFENQDHVSTHSNQIPSFNKESTNIATTQGTNISSPIKSTFTPTIMGYPMNNKLIDEQSTNTQNTARFFNSDSSVHNTAIHSDDATAISRSTMNENDLQCLKNHVPSSFQPHRTIVVRNGRKYSMESTEKAERRYAHCVDEKTHGLRYFEVIDCVPCRTLRPYGNSSNSLSKTDIFQSNNQSTISQIPHNQSKTKVHSNAMNQQNLQSSSPFEFNNSAFSNQAESSTNNTYLDSYDDTRTNHHHEEIGRIFKCNEVSNGFKRIDPSFFIHHNGRETSNGFYDESKSKILLDPYAQSIHSNQHDHYSKQSTRSDYAAPIMSNRKSQLSNVYPDHLLATNTNKPSNQPLYSYSKDLFTKI